MRQIKNVFVIFSLIIVFSSFSLNAIETGLDISQEDDIRWKSWVQGSIDSSPVMADIDFDGTREVIFGSNNKLYCLNATGALLWSFNANEAIRSSPIIAFYQGSFVIIFGSDDMNIYCLDSNGGLIWKYLTGGIIQSTPAIADINNDNLLDVVISSDDGMIYSLNLDANFSLTNSLASRYEITGVPAIVVREDAYSGLQDYDAIMSIIES